MLLGESTAEELKKSIGCVYPRPESVFMEAKGRCLLTGLPKMITITSEDMIEALQDVCELLLESVHRVLENTPPELVADVSSSGIVITGGGAKIWGIDKLIEASTSISTRIADDAELCVAYGLNRAIDWLNDMQDGTINLYRRRQMTSL